jgi:hypothetical protein
MSLGPEYSTLKRGKSNTDLTTKHTNDEGITISSLKYLI